MELKVELSFDQLLDAVKQLPEGQREIIRQELEKKPAEVSTQTDFEKFLLNFPVMDKKQYESYKQKRKEISQWRTRSLF